MNLIDPHGTEGVDPLAVGNIAKSKKGKKDWAFDAARRNFGERTNKCNLFVAQILEKAGANVPWVNDVVGIIPYNFPTAGQWADPNFHIPGFEVVSTPQIGDVVAIGSNPPSAGATGHVGIYVGMIKGKHLTASAGSKEVKVGDWGFRPGQKPTFRRCTCFDE